MDKYFALIFEKKLKIKNLNNRLSVLNKEIKNISDNINNLDQKLSEEIIKSEELTKEQKEVNTKNNIDLVSLIIFILSLIVGNFFNAFGITFFKVVLIISLTNILNVGINQVIIKLVSKIYKKIREIAIEDIERQNYKIEEIHDKILELGKQKCKLYDTKRNLETEINKEVINLQKLMDTIIEEYSFLLDEIIAQEIENNSNLEYEIEIKRLRELIENNMKNV